MVTGASTRENLIVRDNGRGSMQVPQFVRRAAARVILGGGICALAVAVGGTIIERSRFGADLADTRQRIEADVRAQFARLNGELETVTARLRSDPGVVGVVAARDTAATRQLFDRLAAATVNAPNLAITIYGQEARPIAWTGRPATDLPIVRIVGPDALFLAPSPLGVRLTRVVPLNDPKTPERRVATLVAEAPLPRTTGSAQAGDGLIVETSVVPVPLRAGFEGAADAPANAIVVRTANGEPLAAVDVPEADIDHARAQWRTRVLAAVAAVACLMLLLLCGPLLDWRRMVLTVRGHVALTIVVVGLLIVARVVAWFAIRLAGLDSPILLSRQLAGPYWIALASPLDFTLTTCLFGALVAVGAASFEQWRQSRRLRVRVVPDAGPAATTLFLVAHLAAGALVGLLLFGYEDFVRSRLALVPFDIVHFALHPWEPSRLAVVIGLLVLHATLGALAVLIFRLAHSPWVVSSGSRWIRALIPLLWAVARGCGARRLDAQLGAAAGRADGVDHCRRDCRGVAPSPVSRDLRARVASGTTRRILRRPGIAVAGVLSVARRCRGSRPASAGRVSLCPRGEQSAPEPSAAARRGACPNRCGLRSRRAGQRERSSRRRPAVEQRGVPRVVADRPPEPALDFGRAAQSRGSAREPVRAQAAGDGRPATARAGGLVRVGDLRGGLTVLCRRAPPASRGSSDLYTWFRRHARGGWVDCRARNARLQQPVVHLGAESLRRTAATSGPRKTRAHAARENRVHRLWMESSSDVHLGPRRLDAP